MKILSIFTLDAATAKPPTPEQAATMGKFIEELRRKGALIDTGGVIDGSLEVKVERKRGKSTVTDGPFAEAKELVGGYALLEVNGRDQALEFTNQFLDIVGDATCVLHEVSEVT
jgi:hypothetical protein